MVLVPPEQESGDQSPHSKKSTPVAFCKQPRPLKLRLRPLRWPPKKFCVRPFDFRAILTQVSDSGYASPLFSSLN
jgi:hypothetical protein